MKEITNADSIKAWSNAPREIVEQFGEEGDLARQYLLNPALFSLLGDVRGKHILDAGCGQGYLSRLLAKRREYFQERALPQTFGHFFHRTLSSYLNLVIREGCSIQQIIEPQLDLETAHRIGHERNVHVPNFLVIDAMKL